MSERDVHECVILANYKYEHLPNIQRIFTKIEHRLRYKKKT